MIAGYWILSPGCSAVFVGPALDIPWIRGFSGSKYWTCFVTTKPAGYELQISTLIKSNGFLALKRIYITLAYCPSVRESMWRSCLEWLDCLDWLDWLECLDSFNFLDCFDCLDDLTNKQPGGNPASRRLGFISFVLVCGSAGFEFHAVYILCSFVEKYITVQCTVVSVF